MLKVKFANGVVKNCAAPTEQKIYKTISGETVGMGWVLILRLTGGITSNEVDEVLTADNISSLEFLTESETGEDVPEFTLTGYNKITSSVIRHAENAESTSAEIQLSKGV